MKNINLIPFIPFFIISLIHLYYCYTMKLFEKGISKTLLMPFLIFAYYFVVEKIKYNVVLCFFFFWWGDIFFIFYNTYYYAVFCFWVGDIINSYEFIKKIKNFKINNFLISFIPTIPFVIYYGNFMFAKHVDTFMVFVFYGYIIPLYLMVVFSIMIFLEDKNKCNFFLMIGCMLFIFSDCTVIWVSFTESYKLDSLVIMITYLIAQMGIINWYIDNENVEKIKTK